jgi:hypothetical protein
LKCGAGGPSVARRSDFGQIRSISVEGLVFLVELRRDLRANFQRVLVSR